MKKKTRAYLRRWTGLFLAVCVFVTMAVPALADEPAAPAAPEQFHGVYTGGQTYDEHSADNSPLGDLVLPEDFELIDGKYSYGALELEFPDEEGGGDVSVQAGDITTESAEKVVIVYYDEGPDDYYEDHYGTYGVRVSMRDESELLLNTGSINAAGQAVSTDNYDMSKMTMNIDGTITAGSTGINARNYNDSDLTINSGTIVSGTTYLENNTNGNAIDVFAYQGTDITVNVTGDVHAGNKGAGASGTGISAQTSYNSTSTVTISGSLTAEGSQGVAITNGIWENDGHPNTTTVSIGGTVTSDGDAFHVNNNYGTVNITVGGNEDIEDAGNITSGGSYTSFIEADPDSKITFKAGDINGSNDTSSIRPEAHGDRSEVIVEVGNVTNTKGYGIQGSAEETDSVVDIKAGDIDAQGIGLAVDTKRDVYGSTEDGSIYGNGGTVTADVGIIDSGYNGISADLDDGSITVNSGKIDADYNGIDVETYGFNSTSGVTINVAGSVKANETGISVDSWGAGTRTLTYENDKEIKVLKDDPHENWWDRTRYDETGFFILVPVEEGGETRWEKYRSSDVDYEYESRGFSEEEYINLPIYWDVFDFDAEFETIEFERDPENFVNISINAGSEEETAGSGEEAADSGEIIAVSAERAGIETSNNGGAFNIDVEGGVSVSKVRSANENSTITGVMAEAAAGTTNITINGNMAVFGRDPLPTQGGSSSVPDEGDPDSGEDDPDTDEDDPGTDEDDPGTDEDDPGTDEAGPGTDEVNPVFVGNGIEVNSKGGEIDVLLKGSMTAEEGTGIIAQNSDPDGGQAEVIVEGNITAKNGVSVLNQSSSIDVSISGNVEAGDGFGASIEHILDNGGTSSLSIGGSLSAGENGAGIVNSSGTASIRIAEGVTTEGGFGAFVANIGENSETSSLSIGGSLKAGQDGVKMVNYSGDISIDIAGDLNAADGTGVTVTNQGPNWANYGTALLTVSGDLTAKNGINVGYNGEGNGNAQVYVAGDLNAADTGIDLGVYTPPTRGGVIGDVLPVTDTDAETDEREPVPDVDIIVEGTISGSNPIAVNTINAVSSFLVTTWAITPNEDNQITSDLDGSSVKEFEENNINYIIKKEDNEYGSLSVSGTSVKSIPGVTAGPAASGSSSSGSSRSAPDAAASQEKTLDVAKQSTKLTLTVNLFEQFRSGYNVFITNAGQRVDADRNEDGDFSFSVPWAGGVLLSFGLDPIQQEEEPKVQSGETTDPDPDPVNEDQTEEKQTEEEQTEEEQTEEEQTEEEQTEEEQTEEEQTEEEQTEEEQTEEEQTEEEQTKETQTEETQTEETQTEETQTEETQTEEKQTEEKQTEEKQAEEKPADEKPEPEPEPDGEEPAEKTDGSGRVLAILYGEDDAYTIWFMTGYAYKAQFSDGYTETGSYGVKDNALVLTAKSGEKRTPDGSWTIVFGENRPAAVMLADFSDSAKIVGEFNTDDSGVRVINDKAGNPRSLDAIRETINNPEAFRILKALLPQAE